MRSEASPASAHVLVAVEQIAMAALVLVAVDQFATAARKLTSHISIELSSDLPSRAALCRIGGHENAGTLVALSCTAKVSSVY